MDGRRVEVDRRTEESNAVKITVISYGDGSSESIILTGASELVATIIDQMFDLADDVSGKSQRTSAFGDKGLLVDRQA